MPRVVSSVKGEFFRSARIEFSKKGEAIPVSRRTSSYFEKSKRSKKELSLLALYRSDANPINLVFFRELYSLALKDSFRLKVLRDFRVTYSFFSNYLVSPFRDSILVNKIRTIY
ncbi:hypothetical protein PDE_01129 [Penicillium oxalicum 114-2]|uniref:Uncharacterized protein n=1 Tax=Penicillium oxalicum (strain 114-2 / CGMCC 5302) TaxID=933388 RepID=S8AK46_PENO1|nr:hypothetical protein PDE_01129 [Penicillium oxalicum 114-2]